MRSRISKRTKLPPINLPRSVDSGRRRFLAGLATAGAALALAPTAMATAGAESAEPVGTAWSISGMPEIDALAPRIQATLTATGRTFALNGRMVSGNSAGSLYRPIFVRDLATVQEALAFFLPPAFMRTPVEALLATQAHFAQDPATLGAVSAVIDPSGRIDKATVVSDEETSAVQAAFAYYQAYGGTAWIESELDGRSIVDRLGDALDYLRGARRWGDGELIFRGHTTDWGDVKREPGPEPTDLLPGDDLTLSPFDQAWYYRALSDLATMLEALGRDEDAAGRRELAARVRSEALAELWQPDRGHFLVHKHVTDWVDPFDERSTVAVGNALAIHAGLALPTHVEPIFEALDRAAAAATTERAGLSLHPAYPSDFFQSRRLMAGEYQNGAVWDWWGGLQIVSEFEHGRSEAGLAHLRAIAREWAKADGVYEWFHIPSGTSQGSPEFTGAAGTVAQAVIRGVFGVRLRRDSFSLSPRLGARSGWLRATRPGGGEIFLAQTAHPALLFVEYAADEALQGTAAVRLPDGWRRALAFLDGRPLETPHWDAGPERYVGGWNVPGGTHSLIVARAE